MVKTIYYSCKLVIWKTLPAAPVDTFYKTLTISLLTVLPLNLYAILSLALMSVPWRVAKLFGLSTIHLLLYPSKGVGKTTPLNQTASKIKTMRYALQAIENNQAIVPNMKKFTLMQQ